MNLNNKEFSRWFLDGIEGWKTEEIFKKLNALGINSSKQEFISLIDKYISVEELANEELYTQRVFSETDEEADFVWMASIELWKRLRPDKKSLEMISEEIEEPFEKAEKLVWERYQKKIVDLQDNAFSIFSKYCFDEDDQPKKEFYQRFKPHLLDVEYYLCVFCDNLAYVGLWERRLKASEKLFLLDPTNKDFRDLYAEVLLYWNQKEQGEQLYKELIRDFPEEIWHAVHCADMFFLGHEGMSLDKDLSKAEKYYRIAEDRLTDKISWEDREAVILRLFDLYKESKNIEKAKEYREKKEEFEHYYEDEACNQDKINNSEFTDFIVNNKTFPKKKIGRNDLCPCGSGKKYKKCCGK